MSPTEVVVGIVVAGLFIYLLVALLRPEVMG